MIIGQEPDSYAGSFSSSQAFKGSLAGLNMWADFLTPNEIQGMCAGLMNVNGNLFQWRNIRAPEYLYGAVTTNDADAALPGEFNNKFHLRAPFLHRYDCKKVAKSRTDLIGPKSAGKLEKFIFPAH